MSNLRREVLKCFKSMHKARQKVFYEDDLALTMARKKINEEFRKNKHVTDAGAIVELIKYSKEVEHELVTTVIQAKEIKPGRYQLRINPETLKLDNVPYKDCAT